MKENRVIFLRVLLVWIIGLTWLIPVIGILMVSIRPLSEVLHGWWNFKEFHVTLSNFIKIWNYSAHPLWRGLINSFIYVIPGTIIPVYLGSLAGYGFARYKFFGKIPLLIFVFLLFAIPVQAIILPLYWMMNSLDIIDSLIPLIILHTSLALIWIIPFMRNFFLSLPIEVEEAAKIDGASEYQVFTRVTLPLAIPAIISILSLQFIWSWSEFFMPLVFIYTPSKYTAIQIIPKLRGEFTTNYSLLTSGSVIVSIIPIIVFLALQKYWIKGLTGWMVK